jgi:hypothetical protein
MIGLRDSLQGHRCVVQWFRTVGLIAVSTHTFPITAAVRCAVSSREGEEPGATPCRAGDGAGNGREAGISRPLPLETMVRDGDGMALAVIVANEHRAGFEPAAGRAGATRAKPSNKLRLSRSRPPKACSCRRQASIRPNRFLLKPAGGVCPKTARQRRRSASSASERR